MCQKGHLVMNLFPAACCFTKKMTIFVTKVYMRMMTVPKFFNTAGPIKQEIHYNVDPLSRIDLEEIELLIQQGKYFILHAPRQTGKTSCLLALRDYLNEQGNYIAVYANVEAGQASRNNVEFVVKGVCQRIAAE